MKLCWIKNSWCFQSMRLCAVHKQAFSMWHMKCWNFMHSTKTLACNPVKKQYSVLFICRLILLKIWKSYGTRVQIWKGPLIPWWSHKCNRKVIEYVVKTDGMERIRNNLMWWGKCEKKEIKVRTKLPET